MSFTLEYQIESVINKIKHYLITTMGRSLDAASDAEFYRAFSYALREEVMINWTATRNTIEKSKSRKIYYLSMEYMPGRLLGNNLTNIAAIELVQQVLKKMNRGFKTILSIEPDIGIGNGGLGRLASCFLDSLATLQYPAIGYGMRYHYGIFEQALWCGIQLERPDCWLLLENPWEFRRDSHAVNVDFNGKLVTMKNARGETVYSVVDQEQVRALPYDLPIIGYNTSSNFSVVTLRLWSTKESPHNFQLQRYNAGQLDQAAENTCITDVLYPNDNNEVGKRIRLKQEFLLVSASLQDIFHHHARTNSSLANFADEVRIQINDTHPALTIAELVRMLIKNNNSTLEEALEITKTCCSYTNHTVLKEALEEWNESRIQNLLPRQYHIIQSINQIFCNRIREKFPGDEPRVQRMSIIGNGQIKMANLAIFGSHHINGVAKLHSDILKQEMFKDFYEMFPDRFTNVTNGVTQRRWLLYCNPALAAFITTRIGSGWVSHFEELRKLSPFANDKISQEEFITIKHCNKQALLDYLATLDSLPGCHSNSHNSFLGVDALFDIHIKRVHEYKRQLMNALHALILYQELKANPLARKVKRMVIFAGKAAPGYKTAKDIIRFIYCLARTIMQDEKVSPYLRVLFIPNYNVSSAEKIIPAADLSEQISTAGMEASGTGNMKLTINGALTIGTEDGANIEMRESVTNTWWPFAFGKSSEENRQMQRDHSYSPLRLIESNPILAQAMEALRNRSLIENDAEHETLCSLYTSLTEGIPYESPPDRYFVLNDLLSFYATQKKVEDLYSNPLRWAEYAIHNIAGMGPFSADVAIKTYAEKIWGLQVVPPDPAELEKIRAEYSELDRCRILPKAN
ncbi:MAG: glycogen/starch/alpha-glucan phosphorylase [Chlamydiae bacterium]|nr:glycogen/starch/alpha-glucan phosphorylase [Chlamydiota bacterium]